MPKIDQDAQDAYAELRKRGFFQKDPDAAAAAQELVKRGVLKDLSGGTNYAKPAPQASAPSVSQYSLPAAGTPPPPPTPQVRRPGVTFRQPSPKAASLYQNLQGKPSPAPRYDAATEKAIAKTEKAVKAQPKANPTYVPKAVERGPKVKPTANPLKPVLDLGATAIDALPIGSPTGNSIAMEALRQKTAPIFDAAAIGAADPLAQAAAGYVARTDGPQTGANLYQDYLNATGGDGGAAGRAFAGGLVPAAGSYAGFSGGATIGARVPGPAPVKALGGLAGGMVGAFGGGASLAKLQEWLQQGILTPEVYNTIVANRAKEQKQNPTAVSLGQAATALPFADFRSAFNAPFKERAMEGGVEVLGAYGENLITGKPIDTADLIIQALSGAALPGENRLGRVFTGGGQKGAEALIRGVDNVEAGGRQFIADARDPNGVKAQQDALAKSVMDSQARNAFTPLREATRAGKVTTAPSAAPKPLTSKPAAIAPPPAPVATPKPKAIPRPTPSGLAYDSLTSQPGPSLPDSKATMPQYQEAGDGQKRVGKPEAEVLKNQPAVQTREEQIDKQPDPSKTFTNQPDPERLIKSVATPDDTYHPLNKADADFLNTTTGKKRGKDAWAAGDVPHPDAAALLGRRRSGEEVGKGDVFGWNGEQYFIDKINTEGFQGEPQVVIDTVRRPGILKVVQALGDFEKATGLKVRSSEVPQPVNKTADPLTRPAEPVKELTKPEPAQREAPAASAPIGRPDEYKDFLTGKQVWDLTPDEITKSLEFEKTRGRQIEDEILGDDASEWRKMQNMANSMDSARARSGDAAIKRIESKLTQEQVDRLYGMGEGGVDTETLQELKRDYARISDSETAEEMGRSIGRDLLTLKGKTDMEAMGHKEKLALARVRHATSIATEEGWDFQDVLKAALESSSKQFGSAGDFAELMGDYLKMLKVPGAKAESSAPVKQEAKAIEAPAKPRLTMAIKKGTHTKKGHDIWTVGMAERVERGEYDKLNAAAKALGGYYSAFGAKADRGFIFKDEASAKKFKAENEGASAPIAQPDAPRAAVETEVRKDPAASKAMDEGRIVVASVPNAEATELSDSAKVSILEKHSENYKPGVTKLVRRDGKPLLRHDDGNGGRVWYDQVLPSGNLGEYVPQEQEAKADPLEGWAVKASLANAAEKRTTGKTHRVIAESPSGWQYKGYGNSEEGARADVLRQYRDALEAKKTADSQKVIGKNRDGDDIYEDYKGVRSVVKNGIRSTEAVRITYDRDGSIHADTKPDSQRSRDYIVVDQPVPSSTTKEPVFSGKLPEGYTAVYQGDTATGLPYFALYQGDRRVKGNYTESEMVTALRVDMEKQGLTVPVEATKDAFSPEVLKTKSDEDLTRMVGKLRDIQATRTMAGSKVLADQIGAIDAEIARRETKNTPRALQEDTEYEYLGKNTEGQDVFLSPEARRTIFRDSGGMSYEGLKYRGAAEEDRLPVYQIATSKADGATPSAKAIEMIKEQGGTIAEEATPSTPVPTIEPTEEWHVAKNGDIYKTTKERGIYSLVKMPNTASGKSGTPQILSTQTKSIIPMREAIQGLAGSETSTFPDRAGAMARRAEIRTNATSQAAGTLKTEGQPNGSEDTRRREADSRADSPVADDSADDQAETAPRERKPADVSRPDSQGESEGVSAQQSDENQPAATSASGGGRNPRRSAGAAPAANVPLETVEQEAAPAYVAPEMAKDVETGNLSEEDEPSRPNFFRTAADLAEALADGRKLLKLVKAVEALKEVEKQGRTATPEEQKVLADFPGWGWTGNLLSAKNTAKGRYARTPEEKAYERLTGLLDKEEFRAALQATQYSHFTAPEVIVSMWDALRRMGYTGGGSALEPSMGNGLFFQLMPEDMRTKTRLVGVEKDSLTGRIAAQLFQGGKIFAGKGFEEVQKAIGDNSQDVIISNVPFGNLRIFDPEGEKKWGNTLLTGRIHNWFFAKSLEKVKPGGVIAFITSNGTLDANDAIAQETRAHLARGADFLGAIRLPNTAFQKNAGTEVTTDIIFLRKKGENLPEVEANVFQKTAEVEGKDGQMVRVNEYFVNNPDMVLGTHSLEGTMRHGGGNEYALLSDGRDIGIALAEAIEKLPSGVFAPQKVAGSSVKTTSTTQTKLRRGALTVESGKLYVSTPVGDEVVLEEADPLSPETLPIVEKYVGLRDTLRDLINAQLSPDSTDRQKNDLRKKLKTQYDAFVKAHGALHKGKAAGKPAIADHFISDPNAYDVLSLEKWDRKGRKVTGLSDIFSKDVIAPNKIATAATDPKDALGIVLRQGGRVDMEAMISLLKEGGTETTEDALYDQLNKQDLLFKTPQGSYETAEQYGSGNVREKLEAAKRAAIGDEAFESNVKFLEGVQPADKGAADIVVGLGAPWVPTSIITEFLNHLGVRGTVSYSSVVGKFDVTASGFSDAVKASSTFGTNRINAAQLLNHALRGTIPKITDYDKERGDVVNVEATEAAGDKLAEIREEWNRWVYEDSNRANELVDIYNEKVNVFKTRKYDGSSLSFPGQNPLAFPKGLRAHQKNAVWRIIQDRFVLLAHEVGTGKTATMITAAMELRRMGLRQKPLIVVKKPTIGQFAETFKRMYPAARILVADGRNFSAENRKEFMAQIATGDWDAVIVWHNAFEKLSVSPETASQFYNEQIENLEAFVAEQQKADSKSFTAKQAGKKIETLKARLANVQKKIGDRQDDSTYWDDLGVDQIFIDESQTYKNLAVESEIEGMANEGNQITFDMLMKIRSLQARGGGAVFASGTPLTNSIAEIHSLAKYMRPDLLREQGQFNFDDWARTYGSLATSFEQNVAGQYTNKQRFNKFTNVQELMALYRSFADTVFAEDIPGLVRPKLVDRDGKVTNAPIVIETLPDEQQKSFFQKMLARAENIPSMFKAMEIKAAGGTPDTMLKISTEGRQVSLDPRLVMPGAKDNPGSKINKVVKEVLAIHKNKKHSGNQRTQLIFLDQGVPGEKGEWNLYQDITDKLVKGGVDRKEIAWVSDAKTDEAREALFERVSDGSIRIMIGSREKMGVGVNVQERLIAIHQVDPTWRPDQMEQADGRIIRQGNLFAEDGVHIFQYVNKGSFDGFMWKKVAAKLGFINQLLRGDISTNEVEDLSGEDKFSLEQMFAVATGDERVERYIQLGEEVRRLSKAQRYHLGVRADLLRRAASMERELPGLRKTLEGLKSVVEWRNQVPSPEADDSSQARMDSFARYYLDPTDYEKQWYKDAMEKWEKKKEKFYTVKKNADLPFDEPQPAAPKVFTRDSDGYKFTPKDYGIALWRVAMRTEGKGEGGYWRGARVQIFSDKSERIVTFDITPPGAPHSLTIRTKLSPSGASQYGAVLDSRLNDVDNDIKGYEYRIANNEDQIPKAKEQAEKPFAKADELEAKTKELADLTEELGPLLKKGSKRGWGGVVKEETAPEPDMEEVGGDPLESPGLPMGERPLPAEPSSLHMPATAEAELGAMIAPASARVKIAPIKWDRKPLADPVKLIDALALATGRAVLVAKQKRGVAGSYRPSDARTSIRWHGDMETSLHESGHGVDDNFGIVAPWSGKRQKSPFDAELFQQEFQATAKTSMTLKLRRAEAVAEWFRAYAVNPDEAERLAPGFTAHVKSVVPKSVMDAFAACGTGARRLAGAPATEAAQTHIQWGEGDQRSIREKLTETLGEAKDSLAGQQAPDIFKLTFADKLTANFQDALRPVVAATDWARKLTGASHLLPASDPILLMRLHADTVGKVGQMLDNGFVDANNEPVIDPDTGEAIGGLPWLLAPISRPSVAETEKLMKLTAIQGIAERTLEKGQQLKRDTVLTGIGMGLWSDASTARAILVEHDQLDQETKDSIAEALRRYRLVANSLLGYMADSGRITHEDAQIIMAENQQYISLQRVMEDAPLFEGSGKSRRLATVAAPVKKMTGSMRQLRDPFVSLLDQTYKIVAESDRNRAMDAFVDLFRSQRALYAGGVVPLSQVAAQTTTPTEGKNIKVFHNGKAEHWEINDPQVYAALKGLGSPAAPTGPLRILAKISAGIPRALITGNPAFAIRNFSRDMPERWMKDALGSKPWDSFKKFSEEEKTRYALSGGTGMGHYTASRVEYAKAIKAVVKAESKKGTIVRLPSSGALESYLKLLQAAEVQGRLPAYRTAFQHAKDKLGYDDYNAGLFAAGQARGLMDFAVSGNYLRALSPYIPFVNASVQGFAANYKALRKDPAKYLTKFLLLAAAKSLALAILGMLGKSGADKLEEYRALPAYQRDLCINLPLPWADGWLAIPVGFEAASAAGAIERGLDYAMGNKDAYLGYFTTPTATQDDNALMQVFHGSLVQSMLPLKPDDLLSLGGLPGAMNEMRTNYDAFRQKSIVPPYETSLPLAERKGASSASRAGALLAGILKTDPRAVDHLISSTAGGTGRIVTTLSDLGRADKPLTGNRVLNMATGIVKEGPGYGSPQVQRTMTQLRENRTTPPMVLNRAQDNLKEAKTSPQLEIAKRELRKAASGPMPPAAINLTTTKRDFADTRIEAIKAERVKAGLPPLTADQEERIRRAIASKLGQKTRPLKRDETGVKTNEVAGRIENRTRAMAPPGLARMSGK